MDELLIVGAIIVVILAAGFGLGFWIARKRYDINC